MDHGQQIISALRTIVTAADEFMACPNLDALYRRAVEIARDRLGLERCSMFLRRGDQLHGTYSTNRHGGTVDERGYTFDMDEAWEQKLSTRDVGDGRWVVQSADHLEWNGEEMVRIGEGWIAVTPIWAAGQPLGVLLNDTALTGEPVNSILQDIVATYCTLLGSFIERQQAHADVSRAEMLHRQAIGVAGGVVYLLNQTHHEYDYVGPNIEEVLGIPHDEMTVERFQSMVLESAVMDPDAPQDPLEYVTACFRGQIPNIRLDMRVRTPHRGDRWLSVRATNVLDPETGELAASLGILQDVTEQKRAEDELRDLLRLNEATLQTMPSGLFVLDCDLNILKFSPMRAAGSDVDSDPIQIIGQNFADVCSESIVDQQGFLERVRRIAANGGWADVPGLVVQREGGPVGLVGSEAYVDVRIRAFDLAGEGGRPERRVLLVADDVTERVLFADRVTQTSKLESLGVLAGGIAHDFNNILTAIIACSDHVLERGETDERSRREVEEIRQAADHGAALTRQLLAFSRKQKLEPRIQSINEIIEHACAMLELILGEDVVVELDLTEDLGNVEVDRGQIEQVLVNLAANARDAMPDGGVLRIGTASVDMDADCCGSGLADRPHVLVTVSDPGVGMDEATLRKAFDPFFTTKPVGEGTGLGLASVLGIIEQHGGHVRASSAPGKGTTFSVCLPKVDGGEQTVTVGAGSKPAQGSETVLFVEDQALVRLSTKRTLEDYGYHVLCAAEPAEALVLFEQHADEIALLISDVVMPGQNGPELYRTLLDRRPDLKVLYVSGYTDHPSVGDAGVTVDAQLLEKPFAPTTLARRVRDVLDAE